ncbi:hypothetical protein BDZ94DRAFT_161019 [Collybia nuda]|uniref:Uncharacterized protein n=1 Tax=Collybia nuda TaxID=64659 RepID=A0A9P5XWJ6_9AGAR|nr:hypothetical protein BDZ94DRAFT_161019 [Collybia nuda]
MGSMANSTGLFLPNPYTPVAFLLPDQARQKAITDYINVGGLSVLVWVIFTHLHSDYKLVTQYRITLPTIIYLVLRWSTLIYAITSSVFHTAPPVGNCDVLTKVTCGIYHVTASSTALLLFLHMRAIFDRNKYLTAGFFGLWVVVLGGSLTSILSISGVQIGNTHHCAYTNFKSYRSSVTNITLAVFDTCVFFAVTWRLSNIQLSVLNNGGSPSKMRLDIFGKYLPAFTRALLHDGQEYYMVATMINVLVVILDFAPKIPMSYRATTVAPNIGLTNTMACRVFRHTKMRHATQDTGDGNMSAILFRKSNNTPAPLLIHI